MPTQAARGQRTWGPEKLVPTRLQRRDGAAPGATADTVPKPALTSHPLSASMSSDGGQRRAQLTSQMAGKGIREKESCITYLLGVISHSRMECYFSQLCGLTTDFLLVSRWVTHAFSCRQQCQFHDPPQGGAPLGQGGFRTSLGDLIKRPIMSEQIQPSSFKVNPTTTHLFIQQTCIRAPGIEQRLEGRTCSRSFPAPKREIESYPSILDTPGKHRRGAPDATWAGQGAFH